MSENMAAIREALAADLCECEHDRGMHYDLNGSTAACNETACSCRAYGRAGAGGVLVRSSTAVVIDLTLVKEPATQPV